MKSWHEMTKEEKRLQEEVENREENRLQIALFFVAIIVVIAAFLLSYIDSSSSEWIGPRNIIWVIAMALSSGVAIFQLFKAISSSVRAFSYSVTPDNFTDFLNISRNASFRFFYSLVFFIIGKWLTSLITKYGNEIDIFFLKYDGILFKLVVINLVFLIGFVYVIALFDKSVESNVSFVNPESNAAGRKALDNETVTLFRKQVLSRLLINKCIWVVLFFIFVVDIFALFSGSEADHSYLLRFLSGLLFVKLSFYPIKIIFQMHREAKELSKAPDIEIHHVKKNVFSFIFICMSGVFMYLGLLADGYLIENGKNFFSTLLTNQNGEVRFFVEFFIFLLLLNLLFNVKNILVPNKVRDWEHVKVSGDNE